MRTLREGVIAKQAVSQKDFLTYEGCNPITQQLVARLKTLQFYTEYLVALVSLVIVQQAVAQLDFRQFLATKFSVWGGKAIGQQLVAQKELA